MAATDLANLRRIREVLTMEQRLLEERDELVVKAHQRGYSLRRIGTAAGLSPSQVHRITKQRAS